MTPSDSLKLDENLARLLAAYDQGLGDPDPRAPTLNVRDSDAPLPLDQPSEPSPVPRHEGSLSELFPDSLPQHPPGVVTPAGPPRVGRFELRRQLGKGGMGVVFLAYDPTLRREVALKIPRPELLLSADARRRLIREALAAAEFDHPNLVPVYETGEIGPVCYIATAVCPGQTLAEWLDRQAFPVPVRQAARLVAQLGDAVQHAHDRGVLHRDLKPNNVILQELRSEGPDPEPPPGACPLRGDVFLPRIVDFGLAKLAERGPSDTASRQILGTPKYMAPEQAQARHEDVGPAADVYALGVILYELLAGRAPYDGPTDVEVLRQSVEGRMTPPRSLRHEIPRDLEAICLKAMARAPANRYRTAIDFADDLRRFLDGRPTLARPLNALGRAGRWLRRNDQAVALVVVSTIATVLLAIGWWSTSQTRQLITDRDRAAREEAVRMRLDQQRRYSAYVRDAFLSWRAGDQEQLAASLAAARAAAMQLGDPSCFAAGYLTRLARVVSVSVPSPAGPPVAVAVTPDAKRIVTGHSDGSVAVWDLATGELLQMVQAHPGSVAHVVVLSGARVATVGDEGTAHTWALGEYGTLQPGPELPASNGPPTAVAASRDGRDLLLGTSTGEILDASPGRPPRRWSAGQPVGALAVSPDGETLASIGKDGSVRLWEAGTGAALGSFVTPGGAAALTFVRIADSWVVAAGDRTDGTVRVFDRSGRILRTLAAHTGAVLALDAAPDGATLATGGTDECLALWDVATGQTRTILRGHAGTIRGARFARGGQALVTVADDGLLKVWDLTADLETAAVRRFGPAVTAVASGNAGQFGLGFTDGEAALAETRTGPFRRIAADGRGPVRVLRFPADGPPLGVELTGGGAVCWALGSPTRPVLRVSAVSGAIVSADLSADGSRLALGDDHGRVAVWSLASGSRVATLDSGLAGPVRALALSADGGTVATETREHAIGVWEVGKPEPVVVFPGLGLGVRVLRFLPDGVRLAVAGRGGAVHICNTTSGNEEQALLGHVGQVTAVAVAPDGRTLACGCSTGEVKLWDLRTGQELLAFHRHTGPVRTAEFSPDGTILLTGGATPRGRGELAVWDAGNE